MLSEHRGICACLCLPRQLNVTCVASKVGLYLPANPGGSEDQLTSQTQGTPPQITPFEAVVINFVELFFLYSQCRSMVLKYFMSARVN